MHRSQPQHYQLNSKKHHQYQPNGKEIPADAHTNGKKKHFYQLNSKKHHHYQPDPKMYDQQTSKSKEVKGHDPSINGWNLPPLQQKWVRDKHTGSLNKVKDLSVENKHMLIPMNKEDGTGKTTSEDSLLSSGISSKMKIIRNKNKNGRIVIVMSKYMDNGVQSSKVKNSDSPATEKPKQTEESLNGNAAHLVNVRAGQENGTLNHSGDTACTTSEFAHYVPHKKFELSKPKLNIEAGHRTEQEVNKINLPHNQSLQLSTKTSSSPISVEEDAPSQKESITHHQSHRKRNLSEPNKAASDCKKFLSSRSISAPNPVVFSPQREPIDLHCPGQITTGDYDVSDIIPDEPIDLSCGRTRLHAEAPTESHIAVDNTPEISEKSEEPLSHFKPFSGNIIITDVTTNCLTVTFKEYVSI